MWIRQLSVSARLTIISISRHPSQIQHPHDFHKEFYPVIEEFTDVLRACLALLKVTGYIELIGLIICDLFGEWRACYEGMMNYKESSLASFPSICNP